MLAFFLVGFTLLVALIATGYPTTDEILLTVIFWEAESYTAV